VPDQQAGREDRGGPGRDPHPRRHLLTLEQEGGPDPPTGPPPRPTNQHQHHEPEEGSCHADTHEPCEEGSSDAPPPYPTHSHTAGPAPAWAASGSPAADLRLAADHRPPPTALRASRGPPSLPGLSSGRDAVSRAQRILAVIVGLITGVLLVESYGAMSPPPGPAAGRPGHPRVVAAGHRGPGPGHGGLGAGGQAPRASGRCWSPPWPCPPCSRSRSPHQPWWVSDRRSDPGVAARQLRRAQPAVPRRHRR
jgi:hypothetical protein